MVFIGSGGLAYAMQVPDVVNGLGCDQVCIPVLRDCALVGEIAQRE